MSDSRMGPVVACAIKFGPYVVTGSLEGGHAGIFRDISSAGDDLQQAALRAARKEGSMLQGFVQGDGRWVDRASARLLAIHNGQVTEADLPDRCIIFSEDFVMAARGRQ